GEIRTPDLVLRRHALYPSELQPRSRMESDSKAFAAVPKIKNSPFSRYCARTVSKPSTTGTFWHIVPPISLAWRLSFSKASLFICNFICEYFLKTWESPCRSICVTHSSTTPPALSLVAYVDRRS